MKRYARSHLSDQALLRSAATNAGRERTSTADLLADLAEIDARRLYLPAAYPSMFTYCVGELRLSADAAARRIQAARAARRFPVIFDAVAEGRLHLTAVGLVAPHLTEDTAEELLAAATHKTKSEIEQWLAARFPRPDVLAWVVGPSPSSVARSDEQSSSPGGLHNRGPRQIRTRRFPPSGSSADATRGYVPHIATVMRGSGSGSRRSSALNRSQVRRLFWPRRRSHRNQMRAVTCTKLLRLRQLPFTPK